MTAERYNIVTIGDVCDGVPSLCQGKELDIIEQYALDRLSLVGHILELGVAYGGTSHVLAHANEARGYSEKLYMVDLLVDGDGYLEMRRVCTIIGDTVKKFENVYFIVGDIGFLEQLDTSNKFRLAFIDAEHTYTALKGDLAAVIPMMVNGGIIILHDLSTNYPGLLEVWNEIELGYSTDVEIIDRPDGTTLGILKVKDRV